MKRKAWSFHGPRGVLSGCQRVDIVNAMALPATGLLMNLPYISTVYQNDTVAVLTGQTAGAGELPSDLCGNWPKAGNLKACRQVWPLGRWGVESQSIALDELGLLNNRCDVLDQELIGNPWGTTSNANDSAPFPTSMREVLRSEKAKALSEMWTEYIRRYASVAFEGDPANNVGDGYMEPYGLETIINTGYQDAYVPDTLCTAVDSLVVNFDDSIDTNPSGFYTAVTEAYNAVKREARMTGIARPTWAFVTREETFRKWTQIWPCTYNTAGCAPVDAATGRVMVDGAANRQFSDQMYTGEFIRIMGEDIPVIIDDALPGTYDAMTLTSDIYLVPISSPTFTKTNGAITYWEFFNFNNQYGALKGELAELTGTNFQVTPGGRFLVWRKSNTNNCIEFAMLGKQRLMVRAPFLAARITGVEAGFTIASRSPFPGDEYFEDGGLEYLDAPTFLPPIDTGV